MKNIFFYNEKELLKSTDAFELLTELEMRPNDLIGKIQIQCK